MKNLHVVFTMNPPREGLQERAATSPALFNRCVLDWFGDWSSKTLFQVSSELTRSLDIDSSSYKAPKKLPWISDEIFSLNSSSAEVTHRMAISYSFVLIHRNVMETNAALNKKYQRQMFITPRSFLDFIYNFQGIFNEKREDLEEQQRHINVGLEKLHETVITVNELRSSLAQKRVQLEEKNDEANKKLAIMVSEQQEAEQQKQLCLEAERVLVDQTKMIDQRKELAS